MPAERRPARLGKAGLRLFDRVVASYALRIDEVVMLENACRTADIIDSLEREMVDQPLTVKGSLGQIREHPLLSEARQQRALLARLLRQLALPDEGFGANSAGVRSVKARNAAQARWAQPHG